MSGATSTYVAKVERENDRLHELAGHYRDAANLLQQRVEQLETALKPFAAIEVPPTASDGTWVATTLYCNNQVTASQVRRARAALQGPPPVSL